MGRILIPVVGPREVPESRDVRKGTAIRTHAWTMVSQSKTLIAGKGPCIWTVGSYRESE